MVSIASLLTPVLLSAVAVFLLSFLIHMVLPYHRKDYRKLPNEDVALDAFRGFALGPGDYMLPCAGGPEGMKSPEFKEKVRRGPIVVMTVMAGGFTMGKRLAQWFVYLIVVGIFAALVAWGTLRRGADDHDVFHAIALVAFAGYALALWQDSIWYSRSWGTTLRLTVDSFVYALATALIFTWLWPR
jgi:hypothetical protein